MRRRRRRIVLVVYGREKCHLCELADDALLRAGDRLMHIHLADSTRAAPGTGHIDFKEMLRTLNGIGFNGYLSYDCVPPRPDWKTSVTHTIGYMKGIEETMGLLD